MGTAHDNIRGNTMCAINIVELNGNQECLASGEPHYSVDYGVPEREDKRYYIILEDGIPARRVNRELILKQKRRHRSVSSDAYYLCHFLNALHSDEVDLETVTYDYIDGFLTSLYVEDGKSHAVIQAYIHALTDLFESLAVRNFSLDSSLLRYDGNHVVVRSKGSKLTTLPQIKKAFRKRSSECLKDSSVYTKWYTKDQIAAISREFPLVDRCIFLDTLLTGHRIDSALSIQLQDFDAKGNTIYARHTKTGKTHVAPIPDSLTELISIYIIEERSRIVESTGSTSPCLFLNRDGSPRSYAAYYSSMKRVEQIIKQEHPDLGISSLHTHAGRSTFLAAIRSYQLEQRRNNKPTFTDDDILTLMDWKTMSSLENYDLLTRAFEVLPFQKKFVRTQFSFLLESLKNET